MVFKIFFCSEFPDILEKLRRRKRKWQFQSDMLYKQAQKRTAKLTGSKMLKPDIHLPPKKIVYLLQ